MHFGKGGRQPDVPFVGNKDNAPGFRDREIRPADPDIGFGEFLSQGLAGKRG